MAKYDGLAALLSTQTKPDVTLPFAQIAEVVTGGLPPSAYRHRAWWSNERNGRHVYAVAWMGSGWRVAQVDLERCIVTFTRSHTPPAYHPRTRIPRSPLPLMRRSDSALGRL